MAQTSITGIKPAELFGHLNQHLFRIAGGEEMPLVIQVGGFTVDELSIEGDGKTLTLIGHLPGEQPKAARARK